MIFCFEAEKHDDLVPSTLQVTTEFPTHFLFVSIWFIDTLHLTLYRSAMGLA